jgi:hypothetical protein
MKRILLISVGLLLGLCVVCGALGYWVALPEVQNSAEEEISEATETYVAPEIAGPGQTPVPGTYTVTETSVNDAIQTGNSDLDDLVFEIHPDQIELRFGERGQDVTYTAGVTVENGRLALTNPDVDGVPNWVLPEHVITNAVEFAINVSYLDRNDLQLSDVSLAEGQTTIVLAERGT